jgi:hypothetical protein
VLLVASVVFYSVAGSRDSLLAALILFNFAMQFPVMCDRKWLYTALTVNFGCLAYFKYRAFFAGTAAFDLFTSTIVIPLGISFYVFQLRPSWWISRAAVRSRLSRCPASSCSRCSSVSWSPVRSCAGGSSGHRFIDCSTASCAAIDCSALDWGSACWVW